MKGEQICSAEGPQDFDSSSVAQDVFTLGDKAFAWCWLIVLGLQSIVEHIHPCMHIPGMYLLLPLPLYIV